MYGAIPSSFHTNADMRRIAPSHSSTLSQSIHTLLYPRRKTQAPGRGSPAANAGVCAVGLSTISCTYHDRCVSTSKHCRDVLKPQQRPTSNIRHFSTQFDPCGTLLYALDCLMAPSNAGTNRCTFNNTSAKTSSRHPSVSTSIRTIHTIHAIPGAHHCSFFTGLLWLCG